VFGTNDEKSGRMRNKYFDFFDWKEKWDEWKR